MSNYELGWLKDNQGEKIAPRTIASAVSMSDGSSVADNIDELNSNIDELNSLLKFKVVNQTTSGTSSVPLNLSASNSTVLACVELSNLNYFAPVIVSTDGKYYAVIKDIITMSAIGGSKSVSLRVVYMNKVS